MARDPELLGGRFVPTNRTFVKTSRPWVASQFASDTRAGPKGRPGWAVVPPDHAPQFRAAPVRLGHEMTSLGIGDPPKSHGSDGTTACPAHRFRRRSSRG